MTKSPPNRRGIVFEVGAQLEARDTLKNWYAANIEKIDYEDEKVLIHYRQWSHRYDEWFDWSSPYLRPVERIQLRKQGLNERQCASGFQVNQKVLASWSDCRYYPAKILSRDKDDFYTVKFFDGIIKTVKGIKVKPFRKQPFINPRLLLFLVASPQGMTELIASAGFLERWNGVTVVLHGQSCCLSVGTYLITFQG
ncbi:PHD finger protein 20b [Danio aesculapii]|uniref:PHD finger protein 20b n=1 Tax=Danio aesculapii TaxID=1142201 RepID=UPI0024C0902E|nr:PHD finger protein 20b [Danio aesculapii]